jgi:hypothetical protein
MSISQKGKIGVLNNSYGLIRSNQTKEKCGMGTGPLFKEILKDGKPSYITTFGSKTITISIKKYPNLGKPLVIMKRLCMENDINFQPTLINDMLNFVQNFDLKTIINLD